MSYFFVDFRVLAMLNCFFCLFQWVTVAFYTKPILSVRNDMFIYTYRSFWFNKLPTLFKGQFLRVDLNIVGHKSVELNVVDDLNVDPVMIVFWVWQNRDRKWRLAWQWKRRDHWKRESANRFFESTLLSTSQSYKINLSCIKSFLDNVPLLFRLCY